MKLSLFFALSFLVSVPGYSASVAPERKEILAPGEMSANDEVDDLNRIIEDEKMIESGSTVENGLPATSDTEETTL